MHKTSTSAPHRKQRRTAVTKAAFATIGLGAATVAFVGLPTANAAVTTTATVPSATTVGAVDGVTITVSSTGGDNISQVNYLPSCGSAVALPLSGGGCTTNDTGIFAITLAPGSSCTGVSLGAPLANGMVPITINPPLNAAGSCFVNLFRTTLKLGATDVSGAAGFQTQGAASVVNNGVEGALSTVAVTTIGPNANPNNPPQPPAPAPAPGISCDSPNAIRLGSGNDTYTSPVAGTNDVIDAGSGNDVIDGNGGNDLICGGSGNDQLTTGGGNDTISGGSGNDTIKHGTGTDSVDGGSGTDTITV